MSTRFAAAIAALMPAQVAPPAHAATNCLASKLIATGRKANRKATCVSRGASRGAPVDLGCMTRAEIIFARDFARAEARGGCVATGDVDAVEAKVDAHIADLQDALWVNEPAEDDCAAYKLRAAGRKSACKFRCLGRAAARSVPPDPNCIGRCAVRFERAFIIGENRGGCVTVADVASIEALIDAFVDDADTELETGTSTTSTTGTTAASTTTTSSTTTTGTLPTTTSITLLPTTTSITLLPTTTSITLLPTTTSITLLPTTTTDTLLPTTTSITILPTTTTITLLPTTTSLTILPTTTTITLF